MPSENRFAQTTHRAMGTVVTHKVFGLYAEDGLQAVCGEVARIEGLLSRFLPDSEIGRVNRSAGIRSEKVSLDTYAVLSKAVEFSRESPECFDVTIGPLVTLWNRAKTCCAQPRASSIEQVLPLVNHRDLNLDPWKMTAELRSVGQSVDLGGIGKGFAGDLIPDIFKRFGVSSAFSNLGGNVVTRGTRPDGSPWHVGIQHPREENRLIGTVSVVDKAVVTSGDYQRYFTDSAGRRHHHILNPSTGYPAESGLVSVSVVADSCTAADALSTVVFVAGMEKGLKLLRNYPGTEAILVDRDLRIYVTQGLRDHFQPEEGMIVKALE